MIREAMSKECIVYMGVYAEIFQKYIICKRELRYDVEWEELLWIVRENGKKRMTLSGYEGGGGDVLIMRAK